MALMKPTDERMGTELREPPAALRWRLVIFDFDGTLADSFPWFAEVLNDVAARWRFRPVAAADAERLRHAGAVEILRHLRVPGWKAPLVARDLRRRMSADIHRIHPFAGVDSLLAELEGAGCELGIATSNTAANVRAVLGPAALRRVHHLEAGVSIHGKGARLRRMLKRAGVSAAEAIYIGDEIRDIHAARAAGIAAGCVAWGYNRPLALRRERPDLLFDTVREIPARLAATRPALGS
ncbi:HAD hydrolase-like protein [uncultured Thiohalocapsa sp.]|uniref:HAD hydrolase-like protein n=1 Tax=uncultured Thiohalocapsa sp. TaxID=768990 RepID=UPI0025F3C733|nr:HAD hydrolase-like protein [uncultured Thiohalocapsa sp.]